MKHISAIIAGVFITGLVAVAILAVGGNALLNTNTVPVQAAPASSTVTSPATGSQVAQLQSEVQQLTNRVNQYQQREQQYQSELEQAASQVDQANGQANQAASEIQQYQQLLTVLAQRGIIRIQSDGSIVIPRLGFGNSQPQSNQSTQQQGIFQ